MPNEKLPKKSVRLPWYERALQPEEWPEEDDDIPTKRAKQYDLANWRLYLEEKRALDDRGNGWAEGEVW